MNLLGTYARLDMEIKCLPLGICGTCRQPTNGYCKQYDSICEKCAKGYTKAFYQITSELGIQVTKGD